MAWKITSLVLGALIASVVSQEKYRSYRGPPVVPVILPGGFIADTKEVAAAKEYFLNTLAKTAAEVKDEGNNGYYDTRPYQAPQVSYQQPSGPLYQSQSQPQADPVFSPQSQAQRYIGPQYEAQRYDDGDYREEHQPQYIARSDPQVTPVTLDNGYIAETTEVNAAKADNFAAVARALEAVARAAARTKASGYPPVYQSVAPRTPQQSYANY